MKLVEPGKPDVSYGLHKLKGSQASVGGKGGAMPFGEPRAARERVDALERWIGNGAPNN
ncbi:Uncharacterised protein [Burkholderia pseudomallei]|uniref:Uncharacterized protein n=6 Tax=pseudomallei group TaxID=111527 RepID=Q63IG1_BURPS|nr:MULTISPECIES: hypothetical protein [Burkholderia]EIF55669.1 hypothetical protein BP1258A_4711 [Burkholderia pseudomallei 1258a]ABA51923.1 hypothetical protein BURPS1710b_A1216 [Burkholderia pseudomallei 1710b]ABN92980.1 hypothetical protein BURPS1106A_A2852 [Burkholderia pseudomallei 1106a]AFR20737.1 hypothetical protein BPC006_II2814 [Burkholderia pseudomallei BPC006]AHE37437.1 hypothetical protein BBS_3958 [Burkholderia pseudomallei NAU20B-16]